MNDDTKIQWKWVGLGLAPTWATPVLLFTGLLPLDERGVLLLPIVCLMYLTALGQAYIRKTRSRDITVFSFVARYSVVNLVLWVVAFFVLIVRDWHYEI